MDVKGWSLIEPVPQSWRVEQAGTPFPIFLESSGSACFFLSEEEAFIPRHLRGRCCTQRTDAPALDAFFVFLQLLLKSWSHDAFISKTQKNKVCGDIRLGSRRRVFSPVAPAATLPLRILRNALLQSQLVAQTGRPVSGCFYSSARAGGVNNA